MKISLKSHHTSGISSISASSWCSESQLIAPSMVLLPVVKVWSAKDGHHCITASQFDEILSIKALNEALVYSDIIVIDTTIIYLPS